jgi:hypothetical protein
VVVLVLVVVISADGNRVSIATVATVLAVVVLVALSCQAVEAAP